MVYFDWIAFFIEGTYQALNRLGIDFAALLNTVASSNDMMKRKNNDTLVLSARFSPVQMLGGLFAGLATLIMGSVYFIQWNIDHTVGSIHREIEALSQFTESKVINLDTRLEKVKTEADSSSSNIAIEKANSDAIQSDVGNVKSEVAVVKDEVVDVKVDVVAMQEKVDEIDSDLINATDELRNANGKFETLKSILIMAFNDKPKVQQYLTDDRLSEYIPIELFGDEPKKAAALPLPTTGSDGLTIQVDTYSRSYQSTSASGTIANHCLKLKGPIDKCFEKYLEVYEHYHLGD